MDLDLGPMELGAIYALMRHRDDRLEEQRTIDLREQQAQAPQPEEPTRFVGTPFGEVYPEPTDTELVGDWGDFIGQDALKRTLMVYMTKAQEQHEALPHVLLATGFPGYGKTTLGENS